MIYCYKANIELPDGTSYSQYVAFNDATNHREISDNPADLPTGEWIKTKRIVIPDDGTQRPWWEYSPRPN